ncbi:DUF4861 domain-containing protein [Mucilaginibacter sp. UR6-1]|uniref:DUF4861 domain-containing protein n=1 Tax=Mucilaginibacter sp. UR6-1 TaxID=1435643 RepID=UPI001E36B1F9|nr:DUF4861 domain-containing protein [Mucilaginibacter sp. UR6-1]MCC8408318.1 DUF4861 domain-containing protein [Mucilaginibacter sp. UR6-1]
MRIKQLLLITFAPVLFACQKANAQQTLGIQVKNQLTIQRNEVVSIEVKSISKFLKGKIQTDIRIQNKQTGNIEPLQWVDNNSDGKADELLFVASVPAGGNTAYTLLADGTIIQPESKVTAYSRFVPERTDDYAWENDRVAFRTYGPDAQRRTEQHLENGTLSSGIDLWLKRTTQPVIDKWYKGYLTDPGFYHTDHGEGYDPYHVGASRGTGGTGIWVNDSLQVSKNFVTYKTIADGPLRTIFELTYAPYGPYQVTETKHISLDVGSNFSKFEITYTSAKPLPNYTIGITLHKNEGHTSINTSQGIFSHHEDIDNVYIGEGIVIKPDVVQKAFANKSKTPDQSNLLVLTKPAGKVIYYAGFAWQKSGQIKHSADWEAMLKQQAQIIAHPLAVSIKQ